MASTIWRSLMRNKTFRYGAPMLMDPALEELVSKKRVSLESEFEKIKDSNYEDWKNVRGPRPWEDSKSLQLEQTNSAIPKQA
uniref:Cytochrome c oxidase assembly protein COX16 homolog, mitochondrial n=1 Tax=Xenopus tropicalis TaxID=8364 RepID=A0A6I8R1D3_XENTR